MAKQLSVDVGDVGEAAVGREAQLSDGADLTVGRLHLLLRCDVRHRRQHEVHENGLRLVQVRVELALEAQRHSHRRLGPRNDVIELNRLWRVQGQNADLRRYKPV